VRINDINETNITVKFSHIYWVPTIYIGLVLRITFSDLAYCIIVCKSHFNLSSVSEIKVLINSPFKATCLWSRVLRDVCPDLIDQVPLSTVLDDLFQLCVWQTEWVNVVFS
jgi:hypothetical protein